MPHRRSALSLLAAGAAALAAPALASSRRALAAMTDGPFYPPRAWRERFSDWDADLSRVERDGRVLHAQGEHLGLELAVVDTRDRIVDGAEVEIWQCDALQSYHHPDVSPRGGRIDPGFQGFGATRSDAGGLARLRSIRPVPYPGRTPHIHIKLRHAAFGVWTGQLFVQGDPGNERDGLWRALAPQDREPLALRLEAASAADSGLRWRARHLIVVPG